MGTCTGCVQVPTPVYYWNPYFIPSYTTRKSTFQISDILHLSQAASTIPKVSLTSGSNAKGTLSDPRRQNNACSSREHIRVQGSQDTVLNFCVKDKCSVPSALEPLQALCTAGPRGYRETSPTENSKHAADGPSQKELKFGINNILSDGFGKEKRNKGQ